MRGVQVATRWTSAAKLLTTSVDVEDPDNIPAAYFDVPYVEMGFSGATKLSKNGKPVPVELAPSRTAIVELSTAPFLVIPLDDILLVWFDGELVRSLPTASPRTDMCYLSGGASNCTRRLHANVFYVPPSPSTVFLGRHGDPPQGGGGRGGRPPRACRTRSAEEVPSGPRAVVDRM